MSRNLETGVFSLQATPAPRARQFHAEKVIVVWAIGETRAMTERERKLTAAIYVQLPGVLEHVRREGRLPRCVPGGGREIGLRLLVQKRGVDLELSHDERAVFEAIGHELPAERAVLIDAGL